MIVSDGKDNIRITADTVKDDKEYLRRMTIGNLRGWTEAQWLKREQELLNENTRLTDKVKELQTALAALRAYQQPTPIWLTQLVIADSQGNVVARFDTSIQTR